MLTKNEQRVVVVLITLLLAFAFIRYWRAVHAQPPPNKQNVEATATPFASPEEAAESDQD